MRTGTHSKHPPARAPTRARAKRPSASTKRPAASAKRPATPAPRRPRPAGRLPVAVAAIIAVTIVGTSFPVSALIAQHRQLAQATAQLAQVQRQNALLAQDEQQLKSTTEIRRLARQSYQLVLPGQTLYNVLPPAGQSAPGTAPAIPFGDPGNQPLVPPSAAPDMMPVSGLSLGTLAIGTTGSTAAASGGSTSAAPSSGGFWHRVTSTLEFWR